MTEPLVLLTPRLQLVAATTALIDAELEEPDRLGDLLSAVIPADWPGLHRTAVLRFWRVQLLERDSAGWWMHYGIATDSPQPTLVCSAGYKGPPVDDTVEIGYSVIPSRRRQGLATEACRRLIEAAWERGARAVIAHTDRENEPSIGVLRKLGFEPNGGTPTGELEFRLDYRGEPSSSSSP